MQFSAVTHPPTHRFSVYQLNGQLESGSDCCFGQSNLSPSTSAVEQSLGRFMAEEKPNTETPGAEAQAPCRARLERIKPISTFSDSALKIEKSDDVVDTCEAKEHCLHSASS